MTKLAVTSEQVDSAPSTREKLLGAAIAAFTTTGYEGASLREVERSAGVGRGLIAHHFSTKEELWKECVNWLMARFREELDQVQRHLADVSPPERARVLLKTYIRFAARHPEYVRLLVLSGGDRSERVKWMVDTWLRPNLAFYDRLSGSDSGYHPADRAMANYAFMGAASMVFTLPVEVSLVYGVDVTDDDFIEQYAEVIADWVGIDSSLDRSAPFSNALERSAESVRLESDKRNNEKGSRAADS